jgi:uncharacterized OsmC-like protein
MTGTFKTVFTDVRAALDSAPDEAVNTFAARSKQLSGFLSEVAVRDFRFRVDEPPGIGGSDLAPSPVEYVLAALAACQEVTYRLYADALGIPLAGVSVTVEGTIDRRGFFAVDDSVRPGFGEIRATVRLDSPAAPEDLQRLKETVDRHCPVLDVLAHATPVITTFDDEADSAPR